MILALALIAGCVATQTETAIQGEQGQDTLNIENEVPPTSVQDVKEFSVTMGNFYIEPAEIRVKQGDRVRLLVTSVEGDHGIGIQGYPGKVEVAQGETKSFEFTANQSGEFAMFCNVYCGQGHRDMRGSIIVE